MILSECNLRHRRGPAGRRVTAADKWMLEQKKGRLLQSARDPRDRGVQLSVRLSVTPPALNNELTSDMESLHADTICVTDGYQRKPLVIIISQILYLFVIGFHCFSTLKTQREI